MTYWVAWQVNNNQYLKDCKILATIRVRSRSQCVLIMQRPKFGSYELMRLFLGVLHSVSTIMEHLIPR